jgi:hypothetical protein
MLTSPSTTFIVPDLLSQWPWQRRLSPYYEACKEESGSWLRSFHIFDEKSQDAFDRCEFSESAHGLLGVVCSPAAMKAS